MASASADETCLRLGSDSPAAGPPAAAEPPPPDGAPTSSKPPQPIRSVPAFSPSIDGVCTITEGYRAVKRTWKPWCCRPPTHTTAQRQHDRKPVVTAHIMAGNLPCMSWCITCAGAQPGGLSAGRQARIGGSDVLRARLRLRMLLHVPVRQVVGQRRRGLRRRRCVRADPRSSLGLYP